VFEKADVTVINIGKSGRRSQLSALKNILQRIIIITEGEGDTATQITINNGIV
jgi:hypothetical protein